jgi:hypothetical protein
MTDSTVQPGADDGPARTFARAAIPVIIAAASVALVVVAIRSHAVTLSEISAGPDQPTPYSAMESRIPQPAEGEEEPPPPTF